MKMHIRRPTTDRSFCGDVEAPQLMGAKPTNVVDMEEKHRANCPACVMIYRRTLFSKHAYRPGKKSSYDKAATPRGWGGGLGG